MGGSSHARGHEGRSPGRSSAGDATRRTSSAPGNPAFRGHTEGTVKRPALLACGQLSVHSAWSIPLAPLKSAARAGDAQAGCVTRQGRGVPWLLRVGRVPPKRLVHGPLAAAQVTPSRSATRRRRRVGRRRDGQESGRRRPQPTGGGWMARYRCERRQHAGKRRRVCGAGSSWRRRYGSCPEALTARLGTSPEDAPNFTRRATELAGSARPDTYREVTPAHPQCRRQAPRMPPRALCPYEGAFATTRCEPVAKRHCVRTTSAASAWSACTQRSCSS